MPHPTVPALATITLPSHMLGNLALLAARLLFAPILFGAASLIGRARGPVLGGWCAALPLTSGPVALLLAGEHGRAFAAQACVGIVLALPSLAAFALAYAWTAQRLRWPSSVALGCAAYIGCTVVIARETSSIASITIVFLAACVALALALCVMPRALPRSARPRTTDREIIVRMVLAIALVWIVTSAASRLGPRMSGLLTPFPVAASLLAVFTHRTDGPAAAARLLRGLVAGLFSFALFFLVAGVAVIPRGIAFAFIAATIAALGLHTIHALLSLSARREAYR